MMIEVGKSDSEKCVVRIGARGRDDPDTEVHIVKRTGPADTDWVRVERVYVEGKKIMKFDLEPGEYHVAAFGGKTAGVATTAGHIVPYPFNVYLNPPEDHSKDYMRLDIPANVPVLPSLAKSIKLALGAGQRVNTGVGKPN